MGKFWPAGRIFLAKLNAMFSCKWPSKPKSAALHAGKHLMHLKGNKLKLTTSRWRACKPQKLFREIWDYISLHYLLFLDSRTTNDRLRETFFAITLWNCQHSPEITRAVRADFHRLALWCFNMSQLSNYPIRLVSRCGTRKCAFRLVWTFMDMRETQKIAWLILQSQEINSVWFTKNCAESTTIGCSLISYSFTLWHGF